MYAMSCAAIDFAKISYSIVPRLKMSAAAHSMQHQKYDPDWRKFPLLQNLHEIMLIATSN